MMRTLLHLTINAKGFMKELHKAFIHAINSMFLLNVYKEFTQFCSAAAS